MAKYIQTIRRQIADELFECVWPFCEIGTQKVKYFTSFETTLRMCVKWKYECLFCVFQSILDISVNFFDNSLEHVFTFNLFTKYFRILNKKKLR